MSIQESFNIARRQSHSLVLWWETHKARLQAVRQYVVQLRCTLFIVQQLYSRILKKYSQRSIKLSCTLNCVYCNIHFFNFFSFSLFKDFIYLFLERVEEKEKERKWNINVWLVFACSPTGDLAHSPGMCPDWESNQ